MIGTRTALALLALVLLVDSCGNNDSSPDDRFVNELAATSAFPDGVDDAARPNLIAMAHQWCDFLEKPDTTHADVTSAMRRFTASLNDEGEVLRQTLVLGTGAKVYCPSAAARLDR